MRDINECKAEIFRRSENRIRKRKLLKKSIAVTGAMCLCVCLLVFCGPMLFLNNGMAEEDHFDGMDDGYKGVAIPEKNEASSNGNEYSGDRPAMEAKPNGSYTNSNAEKDNIPESVVLLSLTVLKESEKGIELSEITKADVVTGIYNTVSETIERFDRDDYTLYTGDNKELLNQTLGPADKYTLVFYYKSGESAEYTLEGQRLTKLPEGKTVLLTLSEARILRASFGFND